MSLNERDAPKHGYTDLSLEALQKLFFKRVIAYRGEYAAIGVGTPHGKLGVPGAAFLSQAGWMTDAMGDANGWFHCPQSEFEEVTGLSDEAQKRVRENLIKRDLWEEEMRGEDLDVRANIAYRSGGKLFYRIKKEELRRALIDVIYNSPRYRPESEADRAAAREKRNKAERERRKKNRQNQSNEPESEKRVSAESGYTPLALNGIANAPSEGDSCVLETRIHVSAMPVDTLPDLPDSLYIRQQQENKKEQDNKQQLSELAVETLPNGATQNVVDFLSFLNVVVGDDSNDHDKAQDEIGEDVSVLLKDLEMEGNLTREQATQLIERHGRQICDAALDTPGAIGRLVQTLPAAPAPVTSKAGFPAPKSAPAIQTKAALALPPSSGLSSADLEPLVAARLLQIGVKRGPIRNCIQKYGVDYAAAVLQGFEAGHINGNAPAAVVTSLLNDGSYKPRVVKSAPVEGGIAEARSEAERAQQNRDADQIDAERIDAENARDDRMWGYLNEKTQIRIEMIANSEMKFLDESLRTETTFMTLRRTLQRAANAGKLEETAAALKAAREA